MLVHDWPLLQLDDGFRCRRPISKRTVRAFSVVVLTPLLVDDLGFLFASQNQSKLLLDEYRSFNAVVESFFGILKRERVYRVRYRTRQQARADLFE